LDRLAQIDVPAAALLPFVPQATAMAWIGALLLRDRRACSVTAAAAAGLTAAILPRAFARRQPAATGPVLAVLTANLLAGKAAADPVVELVRRTRSDVLFVQELTREAAGRLRAAGLDDLLPHAITDLGSATPRGNGVYARHPISACPHELPTSSVQPVVTMKMPTAQVRLACVHLYAPQRPWFRPDVARWRDDLAALSMVPVPAGPADLPLVIAGDFNSTVDHARFRRLLGRGLADAAGQVGLGLTPTWGPVPGGRFALLTIDHVLADRRCAVLGASVHPLRGTDHRAVFAKLALPEVP
jgi:endonuclease/exonuclease/phosphatase family metal-dependent hydrolase